MRQKQSQEARAFYCSGAAPCKPDCPCARQYAREQQSVLWSKMKADQKMRASLQAFKSRFF